MRSYYNVGCFCYVVFILLYRLGLRNGSFFFTNPLADRLLLFFFFWGHRGWGGEKSQSEFSLTTDAGPAGNGFGTRHHTSIRPLNGQDCYSTMFPSSFCQFLFLSVVRHEQISYVLSNIAIMLLLPHFNQRSNLQDSSCWLFGGGGVCCRRSL